ncbi:MAG: AbrB family transcriptional regulator [Chloroflexi bacterium]|nr:AbrB family transcriptional regulator [Chloroflexota bacterium]
MPAIVNPRGQITIERAARERLGVRPGMVAVQQVVDGQLIITFIPAPHDRSVAGKLGRPPRLAHVEDWREMVEQAIAEEAAGDG